MKEPKFISTGKWLLSSLVAAAIITLALSFPAIVLACGFCTTPGGGLTVVHPKSLDVAVAIRRELDSGLLQKHVVMAADREQRQFRNLPRGRILADRLDLRQTVEVLLIEDGSHYRIEPSVERRPQNRSAPAPIRWITGRAVLLALMERRLNLDTVINRGLLVVEKTSSGRDPAERSPNWAIARGSAN